MYQFRCRCHEFVHHIDKSLTSVQWIPALPIGLNRIPSATELPPTDHTSDLTHDIRAPSPNKRTVAGGTAVATSLLSSQNCQHRSCRVPSLSVQCQVPPLSSRPKGNIESRRQAAKTSTETTNQMAASNTQTTKRRRRPRSRQLAGTTTARCT